MSQRIEKGSFETWLLESGKQLKSAKSYSGAVFGKLSEFALENGLSDKLLVEQNEFDSAVRVTSAIENHPEFREFDDRGNHMYRSALKWFRIYLSERNDEELAADLHSIVRKPAYSETERRRLVAARLGQGAFRHALIDYWGGCAITGVRQAPLLVASHIKPWRDSTDAERLDKFNGLLLNPNHDKAFDRNLISFYASGQIAVSPLLDEPEALSIRQHQTIKLARPHLQYMTYHRERCFWA